MGTFPSVRAITTNICFVGSSTIEIDENIVCCFSKDAFYLLNSSDRKNAVFYGHEVSIDYCDAFGNCRKTLIFVGIPLFSLHMIMNELRGFSHLISSMPLFLWFQKISHTAILFELAFYKFSKVLYILEVMIYGSKSNIRNLVHIFEAAENIFSNPF